MTPSIAERFASITQFQRGGHRAPHKPLLLLIALARLQRGEPQYGAYSEMGPLLAELLALYNRTGLAHPHHPFWRLQNDSSAIWEVPERERLLPLENGGDVSNARLISGDAHGGFPTEIDAHLRAHPSVVNTIATGLLHDNFPPSYHEDILNMIGMPWVVEEAPRRIRDPKFRGSVLRAYNYSCAICGYDGRLGEKSMGLEAAHIKWHAAGGPDEIENGLSLCTFHHKVLDLGGLGIDDELRVVISGDVNVRSGPTDWLHQFHGQPLAPPQRESFQPALAFIRWHRSEVFKQP
jgi:putative restriction endonuclease